MLSPDLPYPLPDAADPVPGTPADRPFQILLQRHEEEASGSFRPAARIALTPTLRASGLLLRLPAEELRSLLLLLTFVTPNGYIHPTLLELAQALRQTQGQTRARMRRLERFAWQGKPLLYELRRESGLHAYAPSPHIVQSEQESPQAPQGGDPPLSIRAAGREAVIAHSRAAYARPRAEVEAEIARANGWAWPFKPLAQVQEELRHQAKQMQRDVLQPFPEQQEQRPKLPPNALASASPSPLTSPLMNSDDNTLPAPDPALPGPLVDLRNELLTLGVPLEYAERLLASHDLAAIRQQIAWLPLRHANSPSRLLVAAIENDYAPPALVRKRNALQQAVEAAAEGKYTGELPNEPSLPQSGEASDADAANLPLP